QRTPLDMTRLARDVFEELSSSFAGRRVELILDEVPAATGDLAMMHQVWFNLISNAVKYTRPCETATIRVSGRREEAHTVYTVSDNGVGFDMKYADKLFGVFQRLHASSEFEGTGVGLALVQRIVLRHGGRVWAEGRPNEGATFHFSLPCRTVGELPASPRTIPAQAQEVNHG